MLNVISGTLSAGVPVLNYQQTVSADNPVGFWLLNDTSGSTASDLGSGANNLTYINTPTLNVSTGLTGLPKGVTFNGSTQLAASSQVGSFNTALSGNWSSEAWFKTTDTNVGAITSVRNFGGVASGCMLFMNISTGKVSAYISNAADDNFIVLTSTTSVNTGAYFHVVATSTSGGAAKLYINAVEEASSSTARSATSESRKFTVGAQTTATYGNYLAETAMAPAFYTSTLSGTQVTNHYNKGI